MATFFNLVTHVLIILGTITMIVFICILALKGKRGEDIGAFEKAIRVLTLLTGFLIYVGSKALGLSFPSLMLTAINTTNPFSTGAVGVVLPSSVGTFVAWYCLKNIRRDHSVAIRLIILITTFILVLFGDTYIATYSSNWPPEQGLNKLLLPNLTFTVGLSLYVIFKYQSGDLLPPSSLATHPEHQKEKYCRACGAQVSIGTGICTKCGARYS